MEDIGSRERRDVRITFYVTKQEAERLRKVTAALGDSQSAYARRAVMFRAGWRGYSGPLFEGSKTDLRQVQAALDADAARELFRLLVDMASTVSALYANVGPGPALSTAHLMIRLGRLAAAPTVVEHLRSVPGSLDLVLTLEGLAGRIGAHHGVLGSALMETAELALDALKKGSIDEQTGS